ncbi:MAG: hypothetical protein JWN04_3575, partial [Myxococcaceae bacterium]|nr:hypothetical protein [Myxococcaceae bacterium]
SRTPVLKYSGLSAPASALYDAERDRYLVSNVNGAPLAQDHNGFISVLSPQGEVTNLKWIEGGKGGAKLDAPKGMTIANGVLYVADISTVRAFDLATGAPKGDISVPGSTSLTDLATSAEGTVYLTDSGTPTGRFDGVGTEAVYVIEQGKAKAVAKGKLGRPSGLLWSEEGLVISPFGASELYRLDAHGAKRDVTQLPAGGLTGLVALDDTLYVTSWQSSTVYRGKLGGTFEVAIAQQTSPGDLALDTKRRRLLVPHFEEDSVEAFDIR